MANSTKSLDMINGSPIKLLTKFAISIISYLFLINTVMTIFRSSVQGMGYGFAPLIAGGSEVIARLLFETLAVKYNSFTIFSLANPASWSFSVIICVSFFLYFYNKAKKIMNQEI